MKPRLFKDPAFEGDAVKANDSAADFAADHVADPAANHAVIQTVKTVELAALLESHDRLYITHAGRKYCLRITAQNKLILTA